MPWGHRPSNYSRSRSTSAWNTKGETCSLNNALSMFDLTEEQVKSADPPVPCQWRSCHGNPYAVVKLSDMRELKARLEKRAKEEEKAALIEKLGGQEAYDKKMAQEQAEKEAAAKAAEEAAERKRQVELIQKYLLALMKVPSDEKRLDDTKIAKTRAKQDWFLRDVDVDGLTGEKAGRSIQYDLRSVIAAAEKRHGNTFPDEHGHTPYSGTLHDKIQGHSTQARQYGTYLRELFDEKVTKVYAAELIQEAYQEARKSIEKTIEEAEERVSQAELQVKKSKADVETQKAKLTVHDNLADILKSSSSKRSATPDKENCAPTESPPKKTKLG